MPIKTVELRGVVSALRYERYTATDRVDFVESSHVVRPPTIDADKRADPTRDRSPKVLTSSSASGADSRERPYLPVSHTAVSCSCSPLRPAHDQVCSEGIPDSPRTPHPKSTRTCVCTGNHSPRFLIGDLPMCWSLNSNACPRNVLRHAAQLWNSVATELPASKGVFQIRHRYQAF